MKKEIRAKKTEIVLYVLAMAVGCAMVIVGFVVPSLAEKNHLDLLCKICGGVIALLSLLALIVACIKLKELKRELQKQQSAQTTSSDNITYIPQSVVNRGKQSNDEKFEQISAMDNAQFVVYIAGLFKNKGYAVTLASLEQNYVDFFAEKNGKNNVVKCMHMSRIIYSDDISALLKGFEMYANTGRFVVTDTFFHGDAVATARVGNVTLIDRSKLAAEYL